MARFTILCQPLNGIECLGNRVLAEIRSPHVGLELGEKLINFFRRLRKRICAWSFLHCRLVVLVHAAVNFSRLRKVTETNTRSWLRHR